MILRFAPVPEGLDWFKSISDDRMIGDPAIDDKLDALYKYLRWGHAYNKADQWSEERKVAWHFMSKYHADAYGRQMTREEEIGYERAKEALKASNEEIRRRKSQINEKVEDDTGTAPGD